MSIDFGPERAVLYSLREYLARRLSNKNGFKAYEGESVANLVGVDHFRVSAVHENNLGFPTIEVKKRSGVSVYSICSITEAMRKITLDEKTVKCDKDREALTDVIRAIENSPFKNVVGVKTTSLTE